MTDSVETISRSAANRLAIQGEPDVIVEVEAELATGSDGPRDQYVDPISLGALIVSVATLAWKVYTDLRARNDKPSKDIVARKVRIQLKNSEHIPHPDYENIIAIVVDETMKEGERG